MNTLEHDHSFQLRDNSLRLDVLPMDQLPPGIPWPNPEAMKRIRYAGGKCMVNFSGLRRGRNSGGQEVVYPMCVLPDGSRIPWFGSMQPGEFADAFGFFLPQGVIDSMRLYVQTASMITGGADAGLETARVLCAVSILERSGNDSNIKKQFGLPNPPSHYRDLLLMVDEAFNADDRGREALQYLQQHGLMPLEQIRNIELRNPGIFLTYLIKQITKHDMIPESLMGGAFLGSIDNAVRTIMQANLGQLLWRNDLVYANIGDAIGFLREMQAIQRWPNAYALGEQVLSSLVSQCPSMRFNTRYSTSQFNQLLVESGLVGEEDLDSGRVVSRANIKTVSSLLTKALVDDGVLEQLIEVARSAGLDAVFPGESGSRSIKGKYSIELFETLLTKRFVSEKMDRLIEQVVESMMRQNDVYRVRVDFADAKDLNKTAQRMRAIISGYDKKSRTLFGNQLGAEIFATWDTPDGSGIDRFNACIPHEGFDERFPAEWMARRVKGLPPHSSFYIASHWYVPAMVRNGVLKLVDGHEKERMGIEIQLGLQDFRGANNLHRQYYDKEAKLFYTVHLPIELVDYVQQTTVNAISSGIVSQGK